MNTTKANSSVSMSVLGIPRQTSRELRVPDGEANEAKEEKKEGAEMAVLTSRLNNQTPSRILAAAM